MTRDATVRELVDAGESDAFIAGRLGCSVRTVARIRARLGLPRRVPGRAGSTIGPWRIAPDERDEITAAAHRAGESVSAWVRAVLLEAARR